MRISSITGMAFLLALFVGTACSDINVGPATGIDTTQEQDTGGQSTCTTASDCDGKVTIDNSCQTPTCTAGACGVGFVDAGTTCTDGEAGPCEALQCDGEGACAAVALEDGTTCDDGSACTSDDSCTGGTCGGTAVVCEASDQCHVAGTCDPATGECDDPAADDGTICDDGNAETGGDTCQEGVCLGEGCSCNTTDDCCDGCLPLNEGNACTDDGLDCTSGACVTGVCTHTPTEGFCAIEGACYADGDLNGDNECQYCDSSFAPLTWRNKLDGVECDDGDDTTGADQCTNGTCAGAACTCDTETMCCDGCFAINELGACEDDGIECTDDACADGECTHVIANGYCLIDGECHLDGSNNPDNTCQYCDSVFDAEAWRNKIDSSNCDDGSACTQTDTCSGGVCLGGNPVECQAFDQCHVAGECDTATGLCSNPVADDGTLCDDGNENTGGDNCVAGECLGAGCVCSAEDECCDGCLAINESNNCTDDGLDCTTDICGGGVCTHVPVTGYCAIGEVCYTTGELNPLSPCQECNAEAPTTWYNIENGTTCDDGDLCTTASECNGGICEGTELVSCLAIDQCHLDGECDPATGDCSTPEKVDGMPCNDDDPCSITEGCLAGVCTPTAVVECPATNPDVVAPHDQCYDAGVCNPDTGVCEFAVLDDDTACDDGDAGTGGDMCLGGECLGGGCTCSDEISPGVDNPCCVDCVTVDGSEGSACPDDGLACTADVCSATGVCDHEIDSNYCVINNVCYIGGSESPSNQCKVCDPLTSQTAWTNKGDGTSCSDGNLCTQTDVCSEGTCKGDNPVKCTALDQCHNVGTCNASTGVCSNPTKTDGTTCNDGNACTQKDTCQSGSCLGSNPVTCTASDQCHDVGVCNPSTGVCSDPAKPNGTSCNDGNVCTDNDTCVNGSCTEGDWKPLGTSCNDGAACTSNDRCQACCIGLGCTPSFISCKGNDTCTNTCSSFPISTFPSCNTSTGICGCSGFILLQTCDDGS